MSENPHPMANRSFAMWQSPLPPPPPPARKHPPFFPPSSSSSVSGDITRIPAHRKSRVSRNRRKNPPTSAAAAVAPSCYAAPRRFASTKRNRFSRFAPYAPRNTTSFIIRAKKAGGIASQVSPYPVTPAILPTPRFSPSREGLVDMAKEEWGVDGYGSMKGLIRLRSPVAAHEDDDYVDGGGWSEGSDVEEHVEVERRLDQDLISRFEMVHNPVGFGFGGGNGGPFLLEEGWMSEPGNSSRVTELEEENLTLRERLFLMEREMEMMKNRLMLLETRFGVNRDEIEVVLDNEGTGDLCSEEEN